MLDRADDLFRRRMSFLGIVGIACTCGVYLMTILRPVLEPFLWALFLVMALHPIATTFETVLLILGQWVFGGYLCSRHPSSPRRDEQEIELTSASVGGHNPGEDDNDSDFVRGGHDRRQDVDVQEACTDCCACGARLTAVTLAFAVVIAGIALVAMLIVDAALQLKANLEIYEKGAQNTVKSIKVFVTKFFGGMPQSVADELSENALNGAKALVYELLTGFLSSTGNILVEVLMFGLYVMFWLCTPIPLNTKTERIFKRYLLLKGAACMCYGASVGLVLYVLAVDIAAVFGFMSFFFSFIPEVGALIAMLLPVPVILFDSRLEKPFLTLFTATAGQLALKFFFANIVEVKLVEFDSTMKMHPVITLLAVTFFGFIWGPTGMLLCVPLMAYVKVVILSADLVPPSYRDPILVILEGDRRAPERHRLRARSPS